MRSEILKWLFFPCNSSKSLTWVGSPEFSVAQPTLSTVQCPTTSPLALRPRPPRRSSDPTGVMGVEVSHQESVVIGWESRGGEVVNPVVIIGVAFRRSVEVDDGEGRSPRIRTPHTSFQSSVRATRGSVHAAKCSPALTKTATSPPFAPPPPPPPPAARPLARRAMIGS